MSVHYPTPEEVGLRIAPHLRGERYRAGFRHALRGGQITRSEHLRLSFREGFRAAKLYLREYRRAQGIVAFPFRARVRLRVR